MACCGFSPRGYPRGWRVHGCRVTAVLGLLAILALLPGCREPEAVAERDQREFRRAQALAESGRRQEALNTYLEVIRQREEAPESHLNAGLIYLDHLRSPLRAIYHFEEYLLLRPDADNAPLVRQLITTAQKQYARSLPGRPFGDDPFLFSQDRNQLYATVRQLRAENAELQQRLVEANEEMLALAAQQRDPAATRQRSRQLLDEPLVVTGQRRDQADETSSPGTPPPPEVYIVEEGDTLSSVSQKVYGTTARWMDIYQANRNQLRGPNDLQVGQELRIPP